MSTLPLSTHYYLDRADYNLNVSNSDLARVNNITGIDGRIIDFYDSYRFNNPVYVPAELHDHIKNNWQHVFTSERETIAIYRWQSSLNMSTN